MDLHGAALGKVRQGFRQEYQPLAVELEPAEQRLIEHEDGRKIGMGGQGRVTITK